jgi:hypothetical protein
MHLKFMQELSSLLMHIPTYLDVIIMSCIDFGDFLNNPLSFGFNSLSQKPCFKHFFYFPVATGLGKGQGQRAQLGNFETNKMRLSGPPGGQQAANESRWCGQPTRPCHLGSSGPRASDDARFYVVLFVLT